ncbi:cell wall protein IFF6-like [Penaeus monodon]|uniref:cell wall protein IFF6-like n=1 Tax=Penaeus monodon TaxID=6687 RepID=UPI0018A6DC07|nr:cell wall protein IFF6-like [Penaeus monodon]
MLKEGARATHAPAPITRERLEASDKEKEIRKNMTTLKKSQGEPVRKIEVKEVVHPKEQRDNVWASRSKNAERSRPDSSGFGNNHHQQHSRQQHNQGRGVQHMGRGQTNTTNSESTSPITTTATTVTVSQVSNTITNTTNTGTTATEGTAPTVARVPTPQEPIGTTQPTPQPMQQQPQPLMQIQHQPPIQQQQPQQNQEPQPLAGTIAETTTTTTTTLAQGSSQTATGGRETTEGKSGEVAERESAERAGGSKPVSSGGRGSRGNRYESSRSGGRSGGPRGSTYPVYRGGRGSRSGDFNRRGRGPPPRFQKRNYRGDEEYYYEDYHPRSHRERKDDWSNSCEGDWNSQGGGGNSNNASSNQNTPTVALLNPTTGRRAAMVSAPSRYADEGKATVVEAGQTDAAGRKLQQQQSRFDRMPPRFQKRREFERQRNGVSGSGGGGGSSSNNGGGGGGGGGGGSKRGRGTPVSSSVLGSGGVGVVLTPANKPGVKEGTPETTEEADWETASESSDPEARKENKEKASNPAPKPDHRKGSKTDRKIGGGSWAPSSGGGSSQGRNSLGKESKVDGPGAPQSASQQRFGEKKAPHKNERNKSGPTSGKGTKNETTVNQVHEIKLNPNMVHQALSEVNNKSKPKQEKANPLEGIDLNNYASVVIVDDQPQVSELIGDILDSNDGFQQVTRRKSGKEKGKPLPEETISAAAATAVVTEATGTAGTTTVSGPAPSSNAKKQPKEKKSRSSKSSGFERSRQSKLPPRLAKQRENNRINAIKNAGSCSPVESPTNTLFPVKDSASLPPPKNAWDKPLTATLRANSPSQAAAGTDGVSQGGSKPPSFDNHDSGVEISDQPNSGGSSQRSSPSDDPTNFAKVDKTTLDGTSVPSQTIIFENTNFKAAGTVNATVGAEYKAKFGEAPKPQRQRESRDRKSASPEASLAIKEEKDKKSESLNQLPCH